MPIQAKQTLQQRLMLAPNVTLALEILRMPTLELQAFLQQQLQDNPLLEMEAIEQDEQTSETSAEQEEPPAGVVDDEEWVRHWRTASERSTPDEDDSGERKMDPRDLHGPTLYEALTMQLGCQVLPEDVRRLGEELINRLNDSGYLEDSCEELTDELKTTPQQLEAAVWLIQQLDPPGIGARDLRECLMLQLERRQATDTAAYAILRDHFPLFAQQRIGALAKALGISTDAAEQACQQLKQLNPKPGRAYAGELPATIIPDLVIHKREAHYDVELNDSGLPHVRMNRTYTRMLRNPDTPQDAKEFLQQRMRQASWVVRAIDERNTTLLAIGRCLISLQREFVEQGVQALKPLTQAQVAGLVGRHPSTVSRAIAGKTIDTPFGVFRLEQLFATGLAQATDNGTVSDEAIKSEIRQLVADEDPVHPLSDASLVEQLTQRQIAVARRTVAKYRTSLHILPAHLRRRRL